MIREELLSIRTVDDPMIVSQSKVCHLADRDIIVAVG